MAQVAQQLKLYDVGNLSDECHKYFTDSGNPIVSASIHCAFVNPYGQVAVPPPLGHPSYPQPILDRYTNANFDAVRMSLGNGSFMGLLCANTNNKYIQNDINNIVNITDINIDQYNALIFTEFNGTRITGPTMGNGFLTFPTQAEIMLEINEPEDRKHNTNSLYADFIPGSPNYLHVRAIGSYKGAFIVWIRLRLTNGDIEEYPLSVITCSIFDQQLVIDGVASILQKRLIQLNPRVVANALDYAYNLARIFNALYIVLSALISAYRTYADGGFEELVMVLKKNNNQFLKKSLESLTNYFSANDAEKGQMVRKTTLGIIKNIILELYSLYANTGNRIDFLPRLNQLIVIGVFYPNGPKNPKYLRELQVIRTSIDLYDKDQPPNVKTATNRLFDFLELFAISKNLKREDYTKLGNRILHGANTAVGFNAIKRSSSIKPTFRTSAQPVLGTASAPQPIGTASAQQPIGTASAQQSAASFSIRHSNPTTRHTGKPRIDVLIEKMRAANKSNPKNKNKSNITSFRTQHNIGGKKPNKTKKSKKYNKTKKRR
jgi:hypothetical protein